MDQIITLLCLPQAVTGARDDKLRKRLLEETNCIIERSCGTFRPVSVADVKGKVLNPANVNCRGLAHTDYYSIKLNTIRRSQRFRPSTTNTTSGAHGGIVQSRTEVDLILTDFDKDKREDIVSLPRKMLVNYTAGNDSQHQKSSTIFNNKKYTKENSV
ncbi:hypothetical protein J6590_096574 [Homalodisca vitripennis]|nr:hypothetical protein J6590_096574 [Homalodisca vitripennis]